MDFRINCWLNLILRNLTCALMKEAITSEYTTQINKKISQAKYIINKELREFYDKYIKTSST